MYVLLSALHDLLDGRGKRGVGGEFFEGGAEAVGPVGGENSSGDVDPLFGGVSPDEFGKESEVFLEEIDVENRGCVVAVVEDLLPLGLSEGWVVGPVFESGKGAGLFCIFLPPESEWLRVVCRDTGEA